MAPVQETPIRTHLTHITATSFHLFSRLPLELQRMIWDFAAYFPREVEIEFRKNNESHDHHFLVAVSSGSAQPPMLAACAEARQEGLRIYKNAANMECTCQCSREAPNPIYVNPSVDMLFMRIDEAYLGINFDPTKLRFITERWDRRDETIGPLNASIWLHQNAFVQAALIANPRYECSHSYVFTNEARIKSIPDGFERLGYYDTCWKKIVGGNGWDVISPRKRFTLHENIYSIDEIDEKMRG